MRPLPQHTSRSATHCAGVGEIVFGGRSEGVLVAHSLGSCVGVAIYDHHSGNAGLLHCQLPSRNLFAASAATDRRLPGRYADEGVSLLLRQLQVEAGSGRRFSIVLAGGSSVLDPHGHFRIGERNLAVVRKVLWSQRLMVRAHDVGGSVPRTLSVDLASGRIEIWSRGEQVVTVESERNGL
jgi:chemotaxis protein CheD